ncbi:hypothetical protein LTR70_005066 [Exophiala xenobiotica]|uniref:Sucrose transporter n=1 Tax=Lithohypha guttulata TaxID=1690604 RepID=A0ABR0K8N8_9EURO|nr:hypothetical protein LTR24_005542 [Lithohypha guttulata]KAK5319313.1 hypothetical protein LTR70_005066 [Exophiala xenobiotica]
MPPQRSAAEWHGEPSIRGKSEATRMILLTFSLIGLQLTWGLEQTYCTPYLLSLGMSKSTTSAVWIAGPLSGLLVQPIVGALADRSTSRFGRRRPFMVVGSAVTSLCLILLGWTKEIVGIVTDSKSVIIVTAVLGIYALDFAINVVQACCRSIIVDVLPTTQQQTGSAWAARMAASGHVVGFLIGTLPLVDILPLWLGGDTQFKKMCLVATLGLFFAVGVTCYSVTERVLLRQSDDDASQSVTAVLTSLWSRIWNLPPRIQQICWCQFWGWIGWFPFLFYSSTWVGETYYRYEHPEQAGGSSSTSTDNLGNIGRLGSLSLVLFSIVTLISSVLLPYLVLKPQDHPENLPNGTSKGRGRFTPRPPPSLGKEIQKVLMRIYESSAATNRYKPDLVTTWALSNLLFALIMVWAPFVTSLRFATTLVALCGVPWAVSCWAPFAEMGVEINRLAHGGDGPTAAMMTSGGYRAVHPTDEDDDIEMELGTAGRPNGLLQRSDEAGAESGELAGIYLEPGKNDATSEGGSGSDKAGDGNKYLNLKGVNSIAVCLFIGAVCAVVAAEATRRLKRMR